MGGQTKGDPGGEIFSFEKKGPMCCGRLPWLLVPGWQLQWLFLPALLIVTIFKFSRCTSGCIWAFWADIDIRPPPLGPGMPIWTRCLMHRCVCFWRYILQNYNYKLHFKNLSTYHIPHVSMGTLAAENLDVCTACDPWDSNIQLTMVKDLRPGPGMPFLDSDTCPRGVIYFCQGFLHCMMPSMDGWRDG